MRVKKISIARGIHSFPKYHLFSFQRAKFLSVRTWIRGHNNASLLKLINFCCLLPNSWDCNCSKQTSRFFFSYYSSNLRPSFPLGERLYSLFLPWDHNLQTSFRCTAKEMLANFLKRPPQFAFFARLIKVIAIVSWRQFKVFFARNRNEFAQGSPCCFVGRFRCGLRRGSCGSCGSTRRTSLPRYVSLHIWMDLNSVLIYIFT